jgi:acyl-CoA thioesterase-2
MDASVDELLELLSVQAAGQGVFTGAPSQDTTMPRVFGGQLLGQALAAASFTTPPDWPCHSLHAYFLRPGKPGRPIDYEVSAMRDGQRFLARKVAAVQRNELIFELTASFERDDSGPEQQEPMPQVPPPESFPPEEERLAKLLEKAKPAQRDFLARRRPIEFIAIDDADLEDRTPLGGPVRRWMRAREALMPDPNLQRCALAYASDMGALMASLRAIGVRPGDPDMQIASLDHALWFHRPFRFDEWHLFSFASSSVASGRGLSRGSVYARDGSLVASIAQEGLMRSRDGDSE